MSLQINITQIKNGYLIATAPDKESILVAQRTQEQPQPTVQFAENFTDVVATLRNLFPNDKVAVNMVDRNAE